jgi:hypothetical protein
MPFWIWLAFQEIPAARALAGGALVMAAVVGDVVSDSQAQRQKVSPPASIRPEL